MSLRDWANARLTSAMDGAGGDEGMSSKDTWIGVSRLLSAKLSAQVAQGVPHEGVIVIVGANGERSFDANAYLRARFVGKRRSGNSE